MKKLLMTAAAVFAFGFANAQEVKFGAKAGLNLSTVSISGDGSEGQSPKSIIGFHVGGFAEFKVSDKFSVQPELLFSTQGVKGEVSSSTAFYSMNTKSTQNLNYINIPVMAKYYVIEGLHIEAGPQVGFLLSVKAETDTTVTTSFPGFPSTTTTTSESTTDKSTANTIDFGLNLGAGYDITENISAGLRYNLGLTNISKIENQGNYSVKNRVLSLSVAYKF